VVLTLVDITERKQAEAALRQANEQLHASEERLRFAAQAASFGCYDLDLVTDQAYRSPEFKALFGLEPQEEFQVDADHLPVYLHPDDRASVRKAVLESRDPQGTGTEDLEYQRQGPCYRRLGEIPQQAIRRRLISTPGGNNENGTNKHARSTTTPAT
jgi:PAS domain-containing protein